MTKRVGIEIVAPRAAGARSARSAENAGHEGSIVVGKVTESKDAALGFDAQNGEVRQHVQVRYHRPDQGRAYRAAGRRFDRRSA